MRNFIQKALITIICLNVTACCTKDVNFYEKYSNKFALEKKNTKPILFTEEALKQINKPYLYGGTSPEKGFDCSGLIYYCAKKSLNIELPRNTKMLIKIGKSISRKKLATGDLIFFNNSDKKLHVCIYIKDDFFIHAPRNGKNIRIDSLKNEYWNKCYKTSRRIFY